MISVSFVFLSCQSDKKEVQSFAVRVVDYLNERNNDALKRIYPRAEKADSFAYDFNLDSIDISYDRMTDGYKVSLGEGIWFVVKKRQNEFQIVRSQGLFAYDRNKVLIGRRSGRITSNMEDIETMKAIADTAFFHYLADESIVKMKKYVFFDMEIQDGGIPLETFMVKLTIFNKSNFNLLASDYKIKVWTTWMNDVDEVKFIQGINIPANDSISVPVSLMYNGSGGTGFDGELIFNFSEQPTDSIIKRYYKPSINDYKEYIRR